MILRTIEPNTRARIAWQSVELLTMIAAISLAWMVGLALGLSVSITLILMIGTALLTGGVLFTFLEIRRIAPPTLTDSDITREALRTVNHSDQLIILGILRRRMAPLFENEACPHHEYFPESPGEDQGQLTSQLSASTPILEELIAAYRKRQRPNC